ncbi:MAG: 5-deoxy-glucuronate isomerase [Actinobacteria bacterium]|nr:5-deoxy-glucuronate isomerase [Actinomycetota bacterium]
MSIPHEVSTSSYVLRDHPGPVRLSIDPTTRGDWSYTGLHVVDLGDGDRLTIALRDQEGLVIPLAADVDVAVAEQTHHLSRASVFSGVADAVYAPVGRDIVLAGTGRVAIATAVATTPYPPAFLPAADCPVATRGAGNMTRLVRNYAMPGSFSGCEKLLVCEVLTPGGNWSSYPAHKHDEHTATERELKEIYYYEIASAPEGTAGFGYHQTTSSDPERPIDLLVEVRTGDAVLVPYGWHGPVVAAPGHDMYYLNVMAGPAADRQWLISDHPAQTWVRGLWAHLPVDPRVEVRTTSS